MSEQIKHITEKKMAALGMNDRQFQEYLNEDLSPESQTYIRSHTSIVGMRAHGRALKTDTLQDMLSVYPVSDERFRFALKILAIKNPPVWGRQGIVWKLQTIQKTAWAE